MGLRVHEGIHLARFVARTGMELDNAVDQTILAQALREGYLIRDDQTLRATAEGRLRLEALLAALVL